MNNNKNQIWKTKLLSNINSKFKTCKKQFYKYKKNKQIIVAIQEINFHQIRNYQKVKIMIKIKLSKTYNNNLRQKMKTVED